MTDREADNQPSRIKIVDRRRFNSEGDWRAEGELPDEAPVVAPVSVPTPASSFSAQSSGSAPSFASVPAVGASNTSHGGGGVVASDDSNNAAQIALQDIEPVTGERTPDPTDDSALLPFLASLATTALGALGVLPPGYGPAVAEPDIAMAEEYISILTMLHRKTQGNLTPEESQAFNSLLRDVSAAYAEVNPL